MTLAKREGLGVAGPSTPVATIAAWSMFLAAVVGYVVGIGALASVPRELLGGPAVFWPEVATSLSFLTYAGLGAFIVARSGGSAVGWVFVAMGCAYQVHTVAFGLVHRAVFVDPSLLPVADALGWMANLWVISFGLVPVLFLIFPTGRLPSRRWRLVVLALVPATLMGAARSSLQVGGRQFAIDVDDRLLQVLGPAASEAYDLVADWLFLALFVPAVIALIRRLRASRGVERQQLTWFVYACVMLVVVVLVLTVAYIAIGPDPAEIPYPLALLYGIPAAAALTALPVAAAIAIVRHRLFDIDLVVRRTLIYGVLSLVLIVAYGAAVLVVSTVLAPFGGGDTVAVAASTLAVAALVQPLRRGIQRAVDRRFYRERYDGTATVDALAGRLRVELPEDALASHLSAAAHSSVRPTSVAVWFRPRHARAVARTFAQQQHDS